MTRLINLLSVYNKATYLESSGGIGMEKQGGSLSQLPLQVSPENIFINLIINNPSFPSNQGLMTTKIPIDYATNTKIFAATYPGLLTFIFLVAKLLYKSKCPSVRLSVCQV